MLDVRLGQALDRLETSLLKYVELAFQERSTHGRDPVRQTQPEAVSVASTAEKYIKDPADLSEILVDLSTDKPFHRFAAFMIIILVIGLICIGCGTVIVLFTAPGFLSDYAESLMTDIGLTEAFLRFQAWVERWL